MIPNIYIPLTSKEKALKRLYFQNHSNTIKINVAYCVYLDNLNKVKLQHWYAIALII